MSIVTLVVGCTDRKREVLIRLDEIGPQKLREDAARLYKDVFAARTADFEEIKASDWPDSFRRFAPRHVGAYPDGMSLTLEKNRDAESGIYVVPQHMEHRPRSSRQASFEELADGIYWYVFTN